MILLKGLKNSVRNIDRISYLSVHLFGNELIVILLHLWVKLVLIEFDFALFFQQLKGQDIKLRVGVRFNLLLFAEYAFKNIFVLLSDRQNFFFIRSFIRFSSVSEVIRLFECIFVQFKSC
jgi:hypothetical protein